MKKMASMACALAMVGLAGCGGDDKAKKELAAARAQISREQTAARGQINKEQEAAQSELADIRQKVRDKQQELADQKKKVESERARLARLKNQVSGARSTISRNTFPGEGTFVVGSDISPGTYRADAMSGCYWARLSSLDTNDIIDNNNSDGPVVIEILSSDKAVEVSGCSDFTKVG